jgi:hypothetical protein
MTASHRLVLRRNQALPLVLVEPKRLDDCFGVQPLPCWHFRYPALALSLVVDRQRP